MSTTANKLHQLSTRELQVFDRIAAGNPPQRIAAELGLSVKTVSTYRSRLLEKLAIRSNAEMATLKAQIALDVAADHALVAAALVAGVTRWEAFADTADGRGEVVVLGIRHATQLDAHGVPSLTPMLRERLRLALYPQAEAEPELQRQPQPE